MTALSIIFVSFIFIVDFNRKNDFLCNSAELHKSSQCANKDVDQNSYLDEKLIYDCCELKKFTSSFNISSTPSLSRLNQICEVNINSATGAMIEAYFKNGNSHNFNMRISKIFSIKRKDHQDIFAKWPKQGGNDDHERMLLWHGTSVNNLQCILQHGLQLPKYDFKTLANDGSAFTIRAASMFGPGVFFADRSSKSAQYTEKYGTGVLLLCEVALGETLKAANAEEFPNAPHGYDSVMGLGKRIPNRNGTLKFEDVYVPAGSTIKHPRMSITDLSHPLHNEYIVFDPTRIIIKFIVKIEWSSQ